MMYWEVGEKSEREREIEISSETDWMNLSPFCVSSTRVFSVAYKYCPGERESGDAGESNRLDTCRLFQSKILTPFDN